MGDALSGFMLMYRKPIPPFPVNNHIQCGVHCLETMVIAVYVDVLHVNLQPSVSYFV